MAGDDWNVATVVLVTANFSVTSQSRVQTEHKRR